MTWTIRQFYCLNICFSIAWIFQEAVVLKVQVIFIAWIISGLLPDFSGLSEDAWIFYVSYLNFRVKVITWIVDLRFPEDFMTKLPEQSGNFYCLNNYPDITWTLQEMFLNFHVLALCLNCSFKTSLNYLGQLPDFSGFTELPELFV